MTVPSGGIAAVESRMNDIRARFDPPRREAPATQPSSVADFAEVLSLVENAPGYSPGMFSLRQSGPGGISPFGSAFAPALSGSGDAVVRQSMNYLGVPYQWGGTDPASGLDCSGFVQRVHRDLGIELPRVSRDQARGGQPVASLAEARPGDVLAFGSPVNHVAIYLGDGQMIHAPRRGDVVKIEPIDRPITGIRRYSAPTATPAAYAPAGYSPVGASGPVTSVPYAGMFNAAGTRHGVDPRLLAAVAQVESNFNPNAVSPAGARGLMQFMPATAAGMGIDPMDPAQAIDGAARYLRTQMDTFGSVELALAAYNAGPGAVSRHGGIPPFAETQAYVPKVLAAMNGVH
ncbi:MAG: lytic transglycosylase domain-containing protein [Acidimicrobiales bacterium]